MSPTALTILIVVGGVVIALGYALGVAIGGLLAKRDVPLPDDPPTWLEEAVRSVRAWMLKRWALFRRGGGR